jgi:NAD(P)-dependent dehydrogenase (short-subunit alcohol dehydrogenase family)
MGMLDGKVAIVTGGASGIGRATALRFAEEGATIVIGDLRAEPREGGIPTDQAIAATAGTARLVTGDVTDPEHRSALVAAAEELGGVDVLVNNAGIFRTGAFLDATERDYDLMMDINVKSMYFMAQSAARAMAANGAGVIVNLSSVAGLQGAAGFTLYCAGKGAVRLFTYALADELGPLGIRVNALHPGYIETSMTREDVPIVGTPAADGYIATIPLRRAGTAEDVANAALLLAGDLTAYVSGSSLSVDGGRLRI